MSPFLKTSSNYSFIRGLPLRTILIVPFVLQIFAAVGLIGYFYFKNGQQAVNDLANQLVSQTSDRVNEHLETFLNVPHQKLEEHLHSFRTGVLDVNDFAANGQHFWKQVEVNPRISLIGYSLVNENSIGAGKWLTGHSIVIDETFNKINRVYTTDEQGQRVKLIRTGEYNPTIESWYTAPLQAQKTVWNNLCAVNAGVDVAYLATSASSPIYGKDKKIKGVLVVETMLSDVSRFLQQLKETHNAFASELIRLVDACEIKQLRAFIQKNL